MRAYFAAETVRLGKKRAGSQAAVILLVSLACGIHGANALEDAMEKIVKRIHSQRCIGYDRDETGHIIASLYEEDREYTDGTRAIVLVRYEQGPLF